MLFCCRIQWSKVIPHSQAFYACKLSVGYQLAGYCVDYLKQNARKYSESNINVLKLKRTNFTVKLLTVAKMLFKRLKHDENDSRSWQSQTQLFNKAF